MNIKIERLSLPAPEFTKLTYPRYRDLLTCSSADPTWVEATGAWDGDKPVGLAIVKHINRLSEEHVASSRLSSIFVDQAYRRCGIASSLLKEITALSEQAGSKELITFHSSRTRARRQFETLLAHNGWEAAELAEFRLGALAECTNKLAESWGPMMKRLKRNGYSSSPWYEMSQKDRADAEDVSKKEVTNPVLDFHKAEQYSDPLLSLALRQHGKVVGWVFAETPEDQKHHHYTVGFVQKNLQKAGWLIAGIFDASQLQFTHYGPKSVTLYETLGDNTQMINFMKKRQAFVTEWMDERFISRKKLKA
ncbi:GNAT family N-acetyltransferase [Terasakiella sp.]|uniref:GNAT family N-acetyltransferase n=1 Tax=Terasakiella sp. TaxID=2034861 RepID=UPI003AA8E9A7